MYPLSSSIDRKKNNVTMIGRKLSTLPTPLKIPSIISDWRTSFTPVAIMPRCTCSVSQPIPISSRLESAAPITLKVSQNTAAIMAINTGIAVYLPVSTLSIRALLACSLLSCGLITVWSHILLIKENLISAIAAARSSPLSFSIYLMICSRVSFSFSSSLSLSRIRESPSASLAAANLTGMSFSLA